MESSGPTSPVRVNLFGGLSVDDPSGLAFKFRTRKTASLFAYLAFFSEVAHARDVLVDQFWQESNLDAGRQSLRMALSSLRSESPNGFLVDADRTHVRLTNVTTDVFEFEALISGDADVSRLGRALKLVKGPLLVGFDDSWIVAQWLRLEEAFAQAAVRYMSLCEGEADRKAGILEGKRATALLGPREDVHLALMRLLVADGQPAQALAQFEVLERELDQQWGEPPTEAAYAYLDTIPKSAARAPSGPSRRPAVTPNLSSFFGREGEMELATSILATASNRLLTVVGTGGTGKTAFARHLAADQSHTRGAPTWMVELADVTAPGRLLGAVSAVVMGASDTKRSLEDLLAQIDESGSLLVLDNFEQLLPEGAMVVKALLNSSRHVQLVVTSRTLLSIEGERAFPLEPLPVPLARMSLAEMEAVPSVSLFCDRAAAVDPRFALGPANAVAVGEICRRVDGLPLAVELAAAKVMTHTPAQILARLGSSMEFLVSRRADVSDRQKSLRAALEWSLAMLEPDVRQSFASLGVFRGGFGFAEAETVAAQPGFEQHLERLMECSLVKAVADSSPVRFKLLEPVREFALSLLGEDELRETRARHFAALTAVAEGDGPESATPSNRAWVDALDTDHENLVAAFESVFDGVVAPARAIRLAKTCRPFFRPRGKTSLWREMEAKLLEALPDDVDSLTRAEVLVELADISSNILDASSLRELCEEALQCAAASGSERLQAEAHVSVAGALKVAGDYHESIKHYESANTFFESVGNHASRASSMRQMAMSYASLKDHDNCYAVMKVAVPAARLGNNTDTLAWCLVDLGAEHANHGFVDEAEACFQEAHALCEVSGSSHMRSIVYWQHGEAQLRTGQFAQSVATHKKSVQSALDASFKVGLKWILVTAGAALAQSGDTALGMKVLSRVAAWREEENRPFTGDESENFEPAKELCRAEAGEGEFAKKWEAYRHYDLDTLIAEVLA